MMEKVPLEQGPTPNGKSHEKIPYFFGLPPFEAILSFIPGQPEAFLSPQRSSEDLSSPSSCKLWIRFLYGSEFDPFQIFVRQNIHHTSPLGRCAKKSSKTLFI